MAPINLPAFLFDTYASYKNGTITFIRWLSSHASENDASERPDVKSVDELRALAENVLARRIKMPSSISWTLRETIRDRTQVSKFFKTLAFPGDNRVTSSHEHFTRTLQHIFYDFEALSKTSRPPPTRVLTSVVSRPSNIFEFLGSDGCISDDDQPSFEDYNRTPPQKILDCGCVSHFPELENDKIGEFMGLAMYLSVCPSPNLLRTYADFFFGVQQLDNLKALVRECWEKAASDVIPIPLAACTTNMAYRAALDLEKDLEEHDIYNPDQFLKNYTTCLHSLNLSSSSSIDNLKVPHELAQFRSQKGPQQGWAALLKFKKFWQTANSFKELQSMDACYCCQANRPCLIPKDDPETFLVKESYHEDDEGQRYLDNECLDSMLKRMGQLLTLRVSSPKVPIPYIYTNHTPLLEELGKFLEGGSSKFPAHTLSLSFGLELLVESLRSYFQPQRAAINRENDDSAVKIPLPCARPRNCRVQSLKFGIDVQGGIGNLMGNPNAPCGCLRIGNSGVANQLLHSEFCLKQFRDTKRFDIYYQAPWTSGQHMVENLARASALGGRAWHHAYYVGTALHIYHTLLKLEVIRSTDFPLMERLCDVFEAMVFLGHRPSRNLLSCYQRWSGGCLNFPKGHCNGMHTHSHSGSMGKKWSMKFVKDVSQGGNHPNRGFDPAKISLFSLLEARNFALDDDILAWTYCSKPWKKATKKDIHFARRKKESISFVAKSVEEVQEKLLDEFRGDFPVARINYFKIYELCVEILKRIHEAEHPSQDPDQICSCVCGRLLSAADVYLDDLRCFKAIQDRTLVEECKQGFARSLEGKSFNNYLWDV